MPLKNLPPKDFLCVAAETLQTIKFMFTEEEEKSNGI